MLMNLHKKDWTTGLLIRKFEDHKKSSEAMLSDIANSIVFSYKRIEVIAFRMMTKFYRRSNIKKNQACAR